MTPEPCDLCGATLGDRETLLVEWVRPVGRLRFDTALRCVDRAGCRARVEAKREPWPIVDGIRR